MPVASVTIRCPVGHPYTHVTEAHSMFEAVSNAVDWFRDPYWHGPKPTPGTVYEVSLVGDSRTWKVHEASVARYRLKNRIVRE